MGALVPIAVIVVSALSATAAVYAAITVASVVMIGLAIISVAATVASIAAYISGDVKLAMMFAAAGIVAGVGAVYLAAAAEAETALALLSEGTATAVASAEAAYAGGTLAIVGYIDAVSTGFQGFLDAIHFKTLLGIHQVVFLLSEDYRNAVQGIYGQIGEVSMALGMSAEWMGLVMRDSRALVLDTSAMMGQSYDLGEIAYMSTLSNYLKDFSKAAERYKQQPANLLWDLDRWVTKPAVDAKASFVQVWLVTVEKMVDGVRLLAEDITRVRNDVARLVADLPTYLRKYIEPYIKPLIKQLDDFMRLTYDPAIKLLSGGITALQGDQAEAKRKIQSTVDRLARPGRYLREIRSLPPAERREDAQDVASIVGEVDELGVAYFHDRTAADRQSVNELLTRRPEIPAEAVAPEVKVSGPNFPEPEPISEIKTPFVGEY